MAVLFALAAALSLGTGDFIGGLGSWRTHAITIVGTSYVVGVSLTGVIALVERAPLDAATAGWSALAGIVGGTAVALLFWAMANGVVSLVSPIAAVVSAVVPIVWGLAANERPAQVVYVGLAIAVPAILLVSGAGPGTAGPGPFARWSVVAALGAGCGFGFYAVIIREASADSGIWRVLLSRLSGLAVMFAVATFAGMARVAPREARPWAFVNGVLDAAGSVCLVLALERGLLSVVGVILALFPVSTVLLARVVLKESAGACADLRYGARACSSGVCGMAGR